MSPKILPCVTHREKIMENLKKKQALIQPHPSLPKQAKGPE